MSSIFLLCWSTPRNIKINLRIPCGLNNIVTINVFNYRSVQRKSQGHRKLGQVKLKKFTVKFTKILWNLQKYCLIYCKIHHLYILCLIWHSKEFIFVTEHLIIWIRNFNFTASNTSQLQHLMHHNYSSLIHHNYSSQFFVMWSKH